MPSYVISRLQHALNDAGKAVKGSRVLVLGLAYKKDVGDTRESIGPSPKSNTSFAGRPRGRSVLRKT
jgi:UDP-N-acetyl-D-mannosaminuronate dehydrogenase